MSTDFLSQRGPLAISLALTLIAVAFFPASGAAQPPPWRQALACDPAEQHYRGLEYCTAEGGRIHVIVVDLHSPDLRLEYIIAEGLGRNGRFGECRDVNVPAYGPVRGGCADPANPAYYPVMGLEEAASRYPQTAALINSDYGAGTQGRPGEFRGHGPEGLTVVRGDRLDGPANGDVDDNAVRRPWLAVSQDAALRAELGQWARDEGGKPEGAYTGVGGGPWLIRDGVIQSEAIHTCHNVSAASCRGGVAQTAVGLTQDRRWLFLVLDLRRSELFDLALFLREELDAWDAIKFDGGGSSQLWYDGRVITAGDGRRLSQYLAVLAPPGTGIEHVVGAPLLAQPTAPLFFDLVLPGETAHLRIEVRNTGTTTWGPGQGIELRRVEKEVVSPVVESYPLPHAVAPGETVTWEIELNTGGSRFTRLYFQMHRGSAPFGPEIGAIVITLPEELRAQKERFEQIIQRQIEEWRQQAEQKLKERMQDLERQMAQWLQRELERQAENLIEQLCGSAAVIPAVLVVWWVRGRHCNRWRR